MGPGRDRGGRNRRAGRVARGSHEEPQLIVLRYEPPDAAATLVAVVGKGVTSTRAAVAEAEGVADGGEVRHIFGTEHPERPEALVLLDTVSYDSWPSAIWREIIRNHLDTYPAMPQDEFEAMLRRRPATRGAGNSRSPG